MKNLQKFAALLIALALIVPIAVQGVVAQGIFGDTVTLIIRLDSPAILEAENISDEDTYRKAVFAEQDQMFDSILRRIDSTAKLVYHYTDVLNAFAITAKKSSIAKIGYEENVKRVYDVTDQKYDFEVNEEPVETILENCCTDMNIDKLHDMGYTGKGQVIAIIDNEFQIDHEMFSGEIKGAKYTRSQFLELLGSVDLSAEVDDVSDLYYSDKIIYHYNYQFKNPDTSSDEVAHGTHVAGIAAGNNGKTPDGKTFTGVAPDAQLILASAKDLYDPDIIAALDDVAKLKPDVLNCSWGEAYAKSDATVDAFDNLDAAGIYVSCSAGNESMGIGNSEYSQTTDYIDYSTIGVPAFNQSTTAVGSIHLDEYWEIYKEMTVDGNTFRYGDTADFGKAFVGSTAFVYCEYGYPEDFAEASGKIAVTRRGKVPFIDMSTSAHDNGALGLIIVNNQDNINLNPTSLENFPTCVAASSALSYFTDSVSNTVVIETSEAKGTFSGESSGGISPFSTYGIGSDLSLVVDLCAFGGFIYSSVPGDEYKTMSGTSMASPHLAGIVALLCQYIDEKYGETDFVCGYRRKDYIKKILVSTASPVVNEDGLPYLPAVQGSGAVDPIAAINTPCVVIGDGGEARISLGDKLSDMFYVIFKIKNLTNKPVVYNDFNVSVLTSGYETDEYGDNYVGGVEALKFKSFAPKSVVVLPYSTANVSVKIKLDRAELEEYGDYFPNGFYVEGYVQVGSKTADIPTLVMPYLGFYGDWTSQKALDGKYYSDDDLLNDGCLMVTDLPGEEADDEEGDAEDDETVRWNLGENYIGSYDDDDYTEDEDFVGFSPNSDGYADDILIRISALRDFTNVKFVITDIHDNIVIKSNLIGSLFGGKVGNIRFKDEEFEDVEDGDYVMTVSGLFPYEGSEPEVMSFKFYVDRVAPSVKSCAVIEKSPEETYLDFTAIDNRGIQYVILMDENGESVEELAVYHEKEADFVLDVSEIDISKAVLVVADYAFNIVEFNVSDLLCEHENTDVCNDVDATSDKNGYTGDTYCVDCGAILGYGEAIVAEGKHFDDTWNIDEENGLHFHECACGYVFDEGAHEGGEATCVSPAVCDVCQNCYGEKDSTNHVHTFAVGYAGATLTDKGYTGDIRCADCNAVIQYGKEIPMLTPSVTFGNRAIFAKLVPVSLVFTSNGARKHFMSVSIDGKVLSPSDYKLLDGKQISVVLSIKKLSKLSGGVHEIAITSKGGTAKASFTVVDAKFIITSIGKLRY